MIEFRKMCQNKDKLKKDLIKSGIQPPLDNQIQYI